MLALPEALQTALDAGAIVVRRMIAFDFPSGLWGFWEGETEITSGGVVYRPSGSVLEISDAPASADLSSAGMTVKLRAIPDAGLTPDVLGTIEDEQYHQRPVAIDIATFDPVTLALIGTVRLWSGYVDEITHEDGPDSYTLVAKLESRSRDHGKVGTRMRTTADQQTFAPGDRFFDAVGTVGARKRLWGRAS